MKKVIIAIVAVAVATLGLSFASSASAKEITSTVWAYEYLVQLDGGRDNGLDFCSWYAIEMKPTAKTLKNIMLKEWKANKRLKKFIKKPTIKQVDKALWNYCEGDTWQNF